RWIDTADIFCHDGPIVEGMRQSGLRTVLCVGNGLAQEPLALAAAGFDVTALDLSPYATELASTATPPRDLLSRFIGGQFADGGQVRFVAGDLRNPDVCPGPFDVVIERRTLQLFPDAERPAALEAVAARLGSRGLFVSHSHDGRWRPPAPRRHWTRAWFEERAWVEWRGGPLDGRACYLVCTTG
ncbi:MAG: class I SAM-dependent methyltransferase, partial [Vicinamibacterales bacterium]